MTSITTLNGLAEISKILTLLTELVSLRKRDEGNSSETKSRLGYAVMNMGEASMYLKQVLEDAPKEDSNA
jgi:hypothetical protein